MFLFMKANMAILWSGVQHCIHLQSETINILKVLFKFSVWIFYHYFRLSPQRYSLTLIGYLGKSFQSFPGLMHPPRSHGRWRRVFWWLYTKFMPQPVSNKPELSALRWHRCFYGLIKIPFWSLHYQVAILHSTFLQLVHCLSLKLLTPLTLNK